MSLLGARQAVCQRPQGVPESRLKSYRNIDNTTLRSNKAQWSKVTVKPSIDDALMNDFENDPTEEFLAKFGPYNGGNPGPFLPGPEEEELLIDSLVDLLLDAQLGPNNYDYGAPVFFRMNPENQHEILVFIDGWIVLIDEDGPIMIMDLP